jgi:hypothetical protein
MAKPNKKALIINMVIAGIITLVGIALFIYGQVAAQNIRDFDSLSSQASKLHTINSVGIALSVIGGLYLLIPLIIFLIFHVFN